MIWHDTIRTAADFHHEFRRLPPTLAVLRCRTGDGAGHDHRRSAQPMSGPLREVDRVAD